MKVDRLRSYKLLLLLLLALGLVLTVQAGIEVGKYTGEEVFFITPRGNTTDRDFTAASLQSLATACEPRLLATAGQDSGLAKLGQHMTYTRLVYTNADYFTMNPLPFYSGGPWVEENSGSLVVNAALAWQLFGNMDVLELPLELDGQLYHICGVSGAPDQIRAEPCAYLSFAPQAETVGESIFLQPTVYQPQVIGEILEIWLSWQGKDSRDYYLTDLRRYQECVEMKARLLGLLIGLGLALSLLLRLIHLLRWEATHSRRWLPLALFFALLLLDLFLVALLLQKTAPVLWAPHSGSSRWKDLYQLLLNRGCLPGVESLPENLAAMVRCNSRANSGLILGAGALISLLWLPDSQKTPAPEEKKQDRPADGPENAAE